jgi:hypothetical protein
VKLFYRTGLLLPIPWQRALEMEGHRHYGSVAVVAVVKTDVPALLTDRGLGQGAADQMAAGLRMQRGMGLHSHGIRLLLAAGVISLRPGVWAWEREVNGALIAEVTIGGGIVPAARFSYDHMARRNVERVLPDAEYGDPSKPAPEPPAHQED